MLIVSIIWVSGLTSEIFTSDITSDIFTPDIFTSDIFTSDIITSDIFTSDIITSDIFTSYIITSDIFTPSQNFNGEFHSLVIGDFCARINPPGDLHVRFTCIIGSPAILFLAILLHNVCFILHLSLYT